MLPDDARPGTSGRRESASRWRAALPVVLAAGVGSWTIFADDGVARTIDAAGERSVDLVTATETRIVNLVDAAVSTVEAVVAVATRIADMAAQIVDTLSRLTSVIG